MSAAEATVVHAYGLVEADAAPGLPGGIDGSEVVLVECGKIAALASVLSQERYGEAAWRDHGQDPRWLEQVAQAHHAVLARVVEEVDVLPLRLPGIYPSLDALRGVLEQHAVAFTEALTAVRAHVEWGAKIFRTGDKDAAAEQPPPASGREYLTRRSAQARDRDEAANRRQTVVLDVHEALAHAATHAVVNPPQDSALSGRREPMMLNAAYLVDRDGGEPFLDLADELQDRLSPEGMTLEISGPWPPYNFAHLPEPRSGDHR